MSRTVAVPVDVPYAYCSPASWADHEQDDVGWNWIKVNSRTSKRSSGKDSNMFHRSRRSSSSSSSCSARSPTRSRR